MPTSVLWFKEICEIKIKIFGSLFEYKLAKRDLKNVVKEINMDMFSHIFLNPQLASLGWKIILNTADDKIMLNIQRLNEYGNLESVLEENLFDRGNEEELLKELDRLVLIMENEPEKFAFASFDNINDEKELVNKINE